MGDDAARYAQAEARFDAIAVDRLQRIGSMKWTQLGIGPLGAFVAEMDLGVAPPIAAALHAMVDDGQIGYVADHLHDRMARATAQRYLEHCDWAVDARLVQPVPDVLKALEIAIAHYSRPGSAIILPTPAYMPFLTIPPSLGRDIIEVPMIERDGLARFDLDGLAAAFAAGGHMMILCNPYNPLGRVFSREELRAVCEVVADAGGRVFSDEIHAPLVHPGSRHVPYASISPAAAAHTITGASASKAWNLAGLKCAQLILSNDADAARWEEIASSYAHGASIAGVLANIAAYESGQEWLEDVLRYLDRNRLGLVDLVAEHLPEARYVPPQGTYLAWLDLRAYRLGDHVARFFLDEANVALSDGAAFGPPGRGFARLNFGTSLPILRQMVTAMGAALRRQAGSARRPG